MTIAISRGFYLGQGVRSDAPLLAYKTIVSSSNIAATSEDPLYPVTNVTNPATSFFWQASSSADQAITITTAGQTINYIGIARHNLAQSGLQVEIKFDGTTVVPADGVGNDQVLFFLISEASPQTVTINITGASDPALIAVIYMGEAIEFERNIYVGHTPITYARERDAIDSVSENGQYIGQIVRNEFKVSQINLMNLTPTWYRQTLDPFLAQSPRPPAFFVWRPDTYSTEVGYVWITGNPKPVNQRANGMMQISMNIKGVS